MLGIISNRTITYDHLGTDNQNESELFKSKKMIVYVI